MQKNIFTTLLATAVLAASCNKDNSYTVGPPDCEPIIVPTYGVGSQVSFTLNTTDSFTYFMTLNNDHKTPITFDIAFPDMPDNIKAVMEENSVTISEVDNYRHNVTLITNNAQPGIYEIPVTITTDYKEEKVSTRTLTVNVVEPNDNDIVQ